MSTTPRSRALRLVAGVGLAAVSLAGTFTSAGASSADVHPARPRPPAFQASGTGPYVFRVYGDAAMNGTGTLDRRGSRKPVAVQVAATIAPDDRTFPAPGECEGAISTMSVYGARGVDISMSGYGEVCGQYAQPPTSMVPHVFVGRYEVLEGPRRLIGTDGFFEIRLGVDGTANAFAIDT